MFVVSPTATEIEVSKSRHLSVFFILSTLRDSKHARELHLDWCCSSTIEKEKVKNQQCISLLFNFHCIFDTLVVNYSATTSLTKLRFFYSPLRNSTLRNVFRFMKEENALHCFSGEPGWQTCNVFCKHSWLVYMKLTDYMYI